MNTIYFKQFSPKFTPVSLLCHYFDLHTSVITLISILFKSIESHVESLT